MDTSGINSAQRMPKVDIESRAKSAREVQLKAADRAVSQPDHVDQQTTARALASQREVSQVTESADEKVKKEDSRRAKLSSELSYQLTRQAIQSKTPQDNPEF